MFCHQIWFQRKYTQPSFGQVVYPLKRYTPDTVLGFDLLLGLGMPQVDSLAITDSKG
jgi:hypothetical protein